MLRMGHIIEQQLDAALQPHGLSLAKLNVLQSLVRAEEPVPLGALSGRLGCVNSNITKLIDRLEADKLVQRLPDPEDRRSKLAAITEEGRTRCRAGRHALEQAERAILERFSPETAKRSRTCRATSVEARNTCRTAILSR